MISFGFVAFYHHLLGWAADKINFSDAIPVIVGIAIAHNANETADGIGKSITFLLQGCPTALASENAVPGIGILGNEDFKFSGSVVTFEESDKNLRDVIG